MSYDLLHSLFPHKQVAIGKYDGKLSISVFNMG